MSLNVATLDQMSFAVFSEETPLKQKTVFYFVAFVRKCLHIVLIRQKTVKNTSNNYSNNNSNNFYKSVSFYNGDGGANKRRTNNNKVCGEWKTVFEFFLKSKKTF